MLTLHYHPSDASLMPHILLEELGLPFALALVDRSRQAHKSPDYLKLNPNGLIPVLVDGDLVLYETAAICLHLADTHPASALVPALVPALGTPQRAHFYKWLMWLTNTLQATLIAYFYPDRWVDAGNSEGARQVAAQAEAKIAGLLDQLDAQLSASGGPWLLGETYSALDPYALMLCRWTRGFHRPARTWPQLGAYLARMLERPAVVRAFATEEVAQPWV